MLWSRECENVRSRANELKIFIALKKPAEVPHINLLVAPYLKNVQISLICVSGSPFEYLFT